VGKRVRSAYNSIVRAGPSRVAKTARVSTAQSHRSPLAGDSIVVIAIALSIAVHALFLAVHFSPPKDFRIQPSDEALEVVLVNAKSKSKPVKAKALAQADLNGGGEEENGRATSFLPKSDHAADGDVLKESQGAVAKLEEQQKKLLSQLRESPVAIDPEPHPDNPSQDPQPQATDAASLAQQMQRMEAQIDKQINDYNSRPRRGFIGPSTKGVSYALYYTQWKERIERIGTLNYPQEARGKMYGDLILSVVLNPDGTIYNNEVHVMRGSGYPVLDRAAESIVRKAAPYGAFPAEMRRDYDVFEIVSKFSWSKGDGFAANLQKH